MTGSAQPGKRSQTRIRPIKTRRDFERVLSITQRMRAQPQHDTAAELRLQALLKEMDRFETVDDDATDDSLDDSFYSGARRRWSDDGADDGTDD